MVCFGISANAQNDGSTTIAVPISNGCGSELSGPVAKAATKAGQWLDEDLSGRAHTPSCDQHDKDYYNGVPKKQADKEFQQRSPVMGTAVRMFTRRSQESYDEAQQDRRTSESLQSTWEEENQQSLDRENRRVQLR